MLKEKFYRKLNFIAGLVILLTIIVTVQALLLPTKTFELNGLHYTEYNNYIIFKQSFFHLINHGNLYILYPNEQWDLYKYSPTFALCMAPLAILPDFLGLFIWNLLNSLTLICALWNLPFQNQNKKFVAIAFTLIELITSIQNSQSNGLIAGLIILAFIAMQKDKVWLATLFIISTVFIKLFGIVALSMLILYPNRLKSILYAVGWFITLTLLPLIVITPEQLFSLYKSWGTLLHNDQVINYGLSVMGWLYTWFGLTLNKTLVVALGAILFCFPFINYKHFKDLKFKMFFISSILLWVIIFNHKAESPTFIIAVAGIAIWYFYQKKKILNLLLLIFAFIFTVLSATDVFPTIVKRSFLEPYVMKAVPCILIWIKVSWDLIFYKSENDILSEKSSSYT